MNPRDLALQALTPTVMVPRYEDLAPLQTVGHRFLVTADGLWLELRRPWLYVRVQICTQKHVPMPYGTVTEALEVTKVPKLLLDEFVELAKAGLPNEVAAAVLWNEATDAMRLVSLEAESSSPGHIRYRMPVLERGMHLLMDIHSHGQAPAFFSRTDNADDATAVKVAGVVGDLDKPELSYAFRVCSLGKFIYNQEKQ